MVSYLCVQITKILQQKSETKEIEPQEVEPTETEPKEIEIPIETKPEPSTQSSSRHIRASFDTTDFE